MLRFLLSVSFLPAIVYGETVSESSGSLCFLQRLSDISLNANALKWKSSDLPKLAEQVLALDSYVNMNDVVTDLWSRPEALAIIEVNGESNLDIKASEISQQTLPLFVDHLPSFASTFAKIKSLFINGGFTTIEMATNAVGTYDGTIQSDRFSQDVSASVKDSLLADELAVVRGLIHWISMQSTLNNGIPDIFHIRISGMASLKSEHGADSTPVREAEKLLRDTILELRNVLVKTYGDRCLILIASLGDVNPEVHHREVRQASKPSKSKLKTAAADSYKPVEQQIPLSANPAVFYDPNYPVIFNIVLWVTLGFFLAVLGIGIWIWFMDPGKDSIIYRMTMTRAKKD